MWHTPAASRRHVQLSRNGPGIGDELRDRLGWDRRIHDHDAWRAIDGGDWRDVADNIKIEIVVKSRIERLRQTDKEERITVCGRTHDRFGGNIADRTRSILDDKL